MTEYKPELSEDLKGFSVNTSHADYKGLEAIAREEGWTQKSFTRVLSLEAKRHMRQAPTPAPAAPAPVPAAKPNFATMSTRELFAHGLAHGSTPSKRGG
jgi:hypothetical protein